jgi:hypothetical protein
MIIAQACVISSALLTQTSQASLPVPANMNYFRWRFFF